MRKTLYLDIDRNAGHTLEHQYPHYPLLARRVFVFCIELRNVFSV